MTKQLTDAEIRARLEKAQTDMEKATDPERRLFLQRRAAAYKMHLGLGTAGRTHARVLANASTRHPRRFSNRGAAR